MSSARSLASSAREEKRSDWECCSLSNDHSPSADGWSRCRRKSKNPLSCFKSLLYCAIPRYSRSSSGYMRASEMDNARMQRKQKAVSLSAARATEEKQSLLHAERAVDSIVCDDTLRPQAASSSSSFSAPIACGICHKHGGELISCPGLGRYATYEGRVSHKSERCVESMKKSTSDDSVFGSEPSESHHGCKCSPHAQEVCCQPLGADKENPKLDDAAVLWPAAPALGQVGVENRGYDSERGRAVTEVIEGGAEREPVHSSAVAAGGTSIGTNTSCQFCPRQLLAHADCLTRWHREKSSAHARFSSSSSISTPPSARGVDHANSGSGSVFLTRLARRRSRLSPQFDQQRNARRSTPTIPKDTGEMLFCPPTVETPTVFPKRSPSSGSFTVNASGEFEGGNAEFFVSGASSRSGSTPLVKKIRRVAGRVMSSEGDSAPVVEAEMQQFAAGGDSPVPPQMIGRDVDKMDLVGEGSDTDAAERISLNSSSSARNRSLSEIKRRLRSMVTPPRLQLPSVRRTRKSEDGRERQSRSVTSSPDVYSLSAATDGPRGRVQLANATSQSCDDIRRLESIFEPRLAPYTPPVRLGMSPQLSSSGVFRTFTPDLVVSEEKERHRLEAHLFEPRDVICTPPLMSDPRPQSTDCTLLTLRVPDLSPRQKRRSFPGYSFDLARTERAPLTAEELREHVKKRRSTAEETSRALLDMNEAYDNTSVFDGAPITPAAGAPSPTASSAQDSMPNASSRRTPTSPVGDGEFVRAAIHRKSMEKTISPLAVTSHRVSTPGGGSGDPLTVTLETTHQSPSASSFQYGVLRNSRRKSGYIPPEVATQARPGSASPVLTIRHLERISNQASRGSSAASSLCATPIPPEPAAVSRTNSDSGINGDGRLSTHSDSSGSAGGSPVTAAVACC